jgi:uncharacterized membrane protein
MQISVQRMIASWKKRLMRPEIFEPRGLLFRGSGCGWILAGVLGTGVLLRITQYWACRSLWLDEAALALNFFDGGFGKLLLPFKPFKNYQAAPVGFNLLSEFMVQIAGISEWSLRFLPLLFGIAAIFVFWRLSRRWLDGGALVFTNYAFAISSTLVYYSNEFKPYMLDVLLGMIVLSGVLAWWEGGRPQARLPWLAVIGGAAVWFSFPVVFVMAGAGGVVLAACWRERKFSELWGFAAVGGAWLIAFGCQYLLFARHISQLKNFTDYFREAGAFMPFPPWKHGGVTWFTSKFFDYFEDVAGLHQSRNILQFIFVCGVAELVRRGAMVRLGVLLAPFALALLAAAMERYPFHGRLVLFTVPFALLICGEGVKALLERLRQPVFRCALIGIALFSPSAFTLPELWRPVKVEEVRPLGEFLQREAGAQDVILVFKYNHPFAVYARLLDLKQTTVQFGEEDFAATRLRITQELQRGRRCWLVMSQIPVRPSHAPSVLGSAVFSQLQLVYRLHSANQQVGAQLFTIEP